MAPYFNIDDVVEGFADLEQRFRMQGDRRAIFVTLYGIVSQEMRTRIAQGAFEDPPWVHQYTVAFANLYLDALEAYDRGGMDAVPRAWRLCFDAAKSGNGLVLQDMLLGVNAHVNSDLSLALTRVSIEPDRARRRLDHDAVNAVLGSVTERATERLAELYAAGLTALDDCAGEVDEMISLFSLEVARDSAWESAVALANARTAAERQLVARLISSRAAVVARLLLAPSRNPLFMAACRRAEDGSSWLTLLAAAKNGVVAGNGSRDAVRQP